MDVCLLEVAMCEKCRSSHFQSEWAVQDFRAGGRGLKNFRIGGGLPIWEGGTFARGGQYPITCHGFFKEVIIELCNRMHAAGKIFVKTYLKAIRVTFFPNMWNFQICDNFIQKNGEF